MNSTKNVYANDIDRVLSRHFPEGRYTLVIGKTGVNVNVVRNEDVRAVKEMLRQAGLLDRAYVRHTRLY